MKLITLVLFSFLITNSINVSGEDGGIVNNVNYNYSEDYLKNGLKKEVLNLAQKGFNSLKTKIERNHIITIIDFDIPSSKKRLWVLDLNAHKVLYHTYVAHGKNSGYDIATDFSNVPESNKSSLGFYVTGKTYQGKHGLSLYLDGLEKGINDKARSRTIVMHGANYVSKTFINVNGRLGRSFGCPAIPQELKDDIIKTISNGSGLFIHQTNSNYFAKSTLVGEARVGL